MTGPRGVVSVINEHMYTVDTSTPPMFKPTPLIGEIMVFLLSHLWLPW